MLRVWFRSVVCGAVAAAALLLPAGDTGAHHAVLRFNLEEMTQTADRIFIGRCVGVEMKEEMIAQGMLAVTEYAFEVERAVKGKLPRRIVVRQLGHPARRAFGKTPRITIHGREMKPENFLHGMSEYRIGEQVLLFIIPDYLGGTVTYPVGLYQGAFFISQMPSGEKVVLNGVNNLGLFTAPYNGTALRSADARVVFPDRDDTLQPAGLSADAAKLTSRRGALPLDSLLEIVDRIVSVHGGLPGEIVPSQRGVNLQ